MTKELSCKICNVNKVRVSDNALSGVCSSCVMKQQEAFDKQNAKTSLQQPKTTNRYKFDSGLKKGYWSQLIDPQLMSGASTKDIVNQLAEKQPDVDKIRIRQLVYIRRGALKANGLLEEKEKQDGEAVGS